MTATFGESSKGQPSSRVGIGGLVSGFVTVLTH
jgi:hypothetical protein